MNTHYVPAVSVNAPSPCPRRPAIRMRKRPMDSLTFTFKSLKDHMTTKVLSGQGAAPASGPNLLSALNSFMTERGFSESESVASALRASYHKNLTQHVERLRSENRSTAYIGNRKSLLAKWRRALLDADKASATGLGRDSPFQLALRELISVGRTVKGTARDTGVPLATLKRWLGGAAPNSRSAAWVPRMERHFGIPSGTLTDLLPQGAESVAKDGQVPPEESAYRIRLRWQSEDTYAVKDVNEELRKQWRDFVAYKTSAGLIKRASDRKTLKRQKNGRWSTTSDPVKPNTKATWYAFQGQLYVATADVNWTMVSQYLGWLMLPESRGGCEYSADDAMSLANFARDDLIERYMNWRIARCGNIKHSGLLTFLTFVSALCNPKTGYLTQTRERFSASPLASSEEMWVRQCADTYEQANELKASYKNDVKASRDSREAVGPALNLPNPLDAIADAVARLDANRPATGGRQEAIWARDRLLFKLLASNPLRDKNVRMMTYKHDNSGHLRKVNGVWRILISKEEFKNARGAAKHREYNMAVRHEVWPDIERYLREYRPMLTDSVITYVFAAGKANSRPMAGLRRRFAILTKRYLKGCAGVGPHGMRHIVATSILKANPNDWAGAAWALHDLQETVERHYAHLRSDDSSRWLEPVMAGPFSRM